MNPKKNYPFLASVPGLGPGKIAKLVAAYRTEDAIKAASPSELRMYVSGEMARRIHSAALAELGADEASAPETPLGELIDAGAEVA